MKRLGILILMVMVVMTTIPVSAQTNVIVLDNTDIPTTDYSSPATGVYLVTRGSTALPTALSYYMRPSPPPNEILSDNLLAIASPPSSVPLGTGAWQSTDLSASLNAVGKVEILIHPQEIFGTGYDIGDIELIRWRTFKPTGSTNVNQWYTNIWGESASANSNGVDIAMLSGSPTSSNNFNAPNGTWVTWTASSNPTAGLQNEITFVEPNYACTSFSSSIMPTLDEFTGGSWTWPVGTSTWSGWSCSPHPFTPWPATIDYSSMSLSGITIGLGSSWAKSVTDYLDYIEIVMDDGSGGTDTVIIDLEAIPLADEPTINKTFTSTPIDVSETSTLTYTLNNSNTTPIGGVAFSDTLPTGVSLNGTVSVSGASCDFPTSSITVTTTGITVADGMIPAGSSCTLSLTVTGNTAGTYTSTTSAVTSTTYGGGTDTATATLVVQSGTSTTSTDDNDETVAPAVVVADPYIVKYAEPTFMIAGQPVTFTFTIVNPTTVAATHVQAVDVVPAEFQILSTETTAGGVTVNGQNVVFSIPTLNGGESVTVTINTRVRSDMDLPIIRVNQACMTADNISERCADVELGGVNSLPDTGRG